MDMTFIPLFVSSSTIFFAFLVILVVALLGLSVYLVANLVINSYRYNKFQMPVEKDLIIGLGEKEQKIVDPIEITKFNIAKSSENELIAESRTISKVMHEEEKKRLEEQRLQELKRLKKELSKKGKKNDFRRGL